MWMANVDNSGRDRFLLVVLECGEVFGIMDVNILYKEENWCWIKVMNLVCVMS